MSLQYWSETLNSPTLSVLPHDFLRPVGGRVVEARHAFAAPTAEQLHSLATRVPGASAFTVGLAAFATLIYRLTGDDDLVILTDCDSEEFIVRVSIAAELPFVDFLARVVEQYARGAAQRAPLQTIAEHLRAQNQLDDLPALYKLSFQHSRAAEGLLSPLKNSIKDLAVFAGETYTVYYNALLYKQERMEILGEQFVQFVAQAAENAAVAVGQVSLITAVQRAALPDPTADLDWSSFRGAIQDIFDANARAHPARTCVVETGARDRTFTYQQINEASNIVGNYLVKTGIRKGDVVMIYAYRGVDLMVAVMGVLKAGATFSVIDPAYPPARQNIYLQVSQPKGLIVIKKAGILDDLVLGYISDELDVVTRIPALEIQDSGALVGGAFGGSSECLSAYVQYADRSTGVVVGPDLNPTLSFTSGSEGIPKGVLGRHFSLAYYFPWMAKRFGLSENDKFTMLSGIAHDPIQRDMFTPLFLGAQLLVPTADDIGTPGRLAAWMAQYGATVTHLTPAMGQLLSAQATAAIPSLHHAFFVGDILTKRDCLRLQTLAQNVTIVNMYGTTETQRAVSYFEVASRAVDLTFLESLKDVMPAGQGMHNVQLLVVNRNDRAQTCGVGEVGEIYVRAGGLAAGYRGLPELNAEKFVTNWYVDPQHWIDADTQKSQGEPWRAHYEGPRDRLYRTGDLGRYLPDGNVECCGRADDQVKIRGFRIELGEIDTHLSQHPGVRENVTLVRRNKDEEPVLVSYVVPKMPFAHAPGVDDPIVSGLIAHADLIRDIKAHLKTRLAAYAVPTLIVPLARLPLNPNGKVDKPKLPFPDTVQLDAVAQLSAQEIDESLFSPMEATIRDLWISVLPQRPATVTPDDSFFDLGGHSILATRMIFELRKQLVVDLALGAIFKFPTIRAFATEVARVQRGADVQLTDVAEAAPETPADYAQDARDLARTALKATYASRAPLAKTDALNVFVTGATGFLGSFILRELLTRPTAIRVFAHVRAADAAAGLDRLRTASKAFGIWNEAWTSSIEVVLGDLSVEQFGLTDEKWAALADTIDVVVHNGAFVHWVYPYTMLRDANVIGTVNVLNLCAHGKAKQFSFVSSTSALDTEHFVRESDRLIAEGKAGLSEEDTLEGSAEGLGTGYGQSKWAAEYIIREAGRRGLRGCITRPGYVVGHTTTGSQNTDDFLLRMLKGCVEIGQYPDITNFVNMVPVDQVARVVVATALHPPKSDVLAVAHVTGHPRIRFNEFLGALAPYGYDVKATDYMAWRAALERYVVAGADSALFPLLHFVLDNLPQDTKAPELDDANARASLKMDAEWTGADFSAGMGVDLAQMAIYAAYLSKIEFLPKPVLAGVALPEVDLSEETIQLVLSGAGGRGSAAK
ncbi:hypothetical protein BABINDRAFT_162428 [Babjeviella inositovora NRRL Y-12698]|uniref:Alpha-aminoadipate reductase n=1 Tax=Babjeviella inositovora NRRL Y-12698 TaxID=984486 RepID=A0A1E3QM14_9ASCO|nr:uncharacterized protein BABINDRAFT_162428 [Babjeviella inositovora NRRL Y-12698]ODQ78736.1 hypothetical protein BABINDRAFT_162428 [Babjeviella inositovora NRRL Y-12698]